jgi:hypothetical protein
VKGKAIRTSSLENLETFLFLPSSSFSAFFLFPPTITLLGRSVYDSPPLVDPTVDPVWPKGPVRFLAIDRVDTDNDTFVDVDADVLPSMGCCRIGAEVETIIIGGGDAMVKMWEV